MNKAHTNINWENYSSYNTPLNAQNLNKMDVSIDLIDDRVIVLDTTKFDKVDAQNLVKSISLDRDTGIFTITYFNGTFEIIDTLLEKIAVNFGYDATTQKLSITLDDGTVEYIDLTALITQYEFSDSDTVAFQVQTDGKIKAVVKKGSITEEYLQPNYLADIRIEAAKAQQSATNAEESALNSANSATLSESWAVGGTGTREGENEDNAKEYARQAKESADSANSIITETFVLQSEKGIPGGIPTLGESGKIPQEQIPDMEGVVLGVKGNLESEYRTGYINLTAEDIGALAVDGDSKENTVTFTSRDEGNPSVWHEVAIIEGGEYHKTLFSRISAMFRNVRYLFKVLGDTDISAIGNGTVTGAINSLNTETKTKSSITLNGEYNSFADIPIYGAPCFAWYIVQYSGSDAHAPIQDSLPWWWNVLQFGIYTRLTQIAFCPYRYEGCIFMRQRHDETWKPWVIIQGDNIYK